MQNLHTSCNAEGVVTRWGPEDDLVMGNFNIASAVFVGEPNPQQSKGKYLSLETSEDMFALSHPIAVRPSFQWWLRETRPVLHHKRNETKHKSSSWFHCKVSAPLLFPSTTSKGRFKIFPLEMDSGIGQKLFCLLSSSLTGLIWKLRGRA